MLALSGQRSPKELKNERLVAPTNYRQIGRVGTFENFVDVGRRAAMKIVWLAFCFNSLKQNEFVLGFC
jgi:hypothetical protein